MQVGSMFENQLMLIPHVKEEEEKSNDHINMHKKHLKKYNPCHDKNTQQIRKITKTSSI